MKRILSLTPVFLTIFLTSCIQDVGDITPSNLKIEALNETSVKLTWQKPLDEIDFYILEFVDNNNQLRRKDTIAPTITSYTHDPDGHVGTYKLYGQKGDTISDPVIATSIPFYYTIPHTIPHTIPLTLHELDRPGPSGLALGDARSWDPKPYPCSNNDAPQQVDFYYTDASQGSSGLYQYLASAHIIATDFEESRVGDNTSGWRKNYIKSGAPQNGIIPPIDNLNTKVIVDSNSVYCFKVARVVPTNDTIYYYGTLKTGVKTSDSIKIEKITIQNIPNFRVIGR